MTLFKKKKIRIINSDGTETWINKPKENESLLSKRTRGEKIAHWVLAIILTIHCASLFIPWIWTFLQALKESFEYASGNALALPKKWLFSNFITAFSLLKVGDTTFVGMLWNSLWYVGLNTALDLFVPACTGYVLSKYKFKGRDLIYGVAITCMTIPIVGNMASAFKLYYDMGIYDTPLWVVWTSMGGFGGTFLIYYGYFKNVSWSYAEATMMDGGGPYTIFFKIMLPQAMPLIVTYAITGAITSWNDYMSFITYMPSWPNLATGLYQYQASMIRMANYPVYFAGVLISCIPPIVIFISASSKVMTSLSIGGLKG